MKFVDIPWPKFVKMMDRIIEMGKNGWTYSNNNGDEIIFSHNLYGEFKFENDKQLRAFLRKWNNEDGI